VQNFGSTYSTHENSNWPRRSAMTNDVTPDCDWSPFRGIRYRLAALHSSYFDRNVIRWWDLSDARPRGRLAGRLAGPMGVSHHSSHSHVPVQVIAEVRSTATSSSPGEPQAPSSRPPAPYLDNTAMPAQIPGILFRRRESIKGPDNRPRGPFYITKTSGFNTDADALRQGINLSKLVEKIWTMGVEITS